MFPNPEPLFQIDAAVSVAKALNPCFWVSGRPERQEAINPGFWPALFLAGPKPWFLAGQIDAAVSVAKAIVGAGKSPETFV